MERPPKTSCWGWNAFGAMTGGQLAAVAIEFESTYERIEGMIVFDSMRLEAFKTLDWGAVTFLCVAFALLSLWRPGGRSGSWTFASAFAVLALTAWFEGSIDLAFAALACVVLSVGSFIAMKRGDNTQSGETREA